jgi:hypothetical protein
MQSAKPAPLGRRLNMEGIAAQYNLKLSDSLTALHNAGGFMSGWMTAILILSMFGARRPDG